MVTVELENDELVLLIQLANLHVVKLQQAQIDAGRDLCNIATPFEAALLQKLLAVRAAG
jgi:hypothetical protein